MNRTELAKRAVACGSDWAWLPRMHVDMVFDADAYEADGGTVLWPKEGGAYVFNDDGEERSYPTERMLPNFNDAATRGCLLALTRRAWQCDEWRRLTIEPAGDGWCIVVRNGRHRPPSRARAGWDLDPVAHPRYRDVPSPFGSNEFATEEEAMVVALEAAHRLRSAPHGTNRAPSVG